MPNGNTVTNVSAGKPKVSGAIFSAPLTATVPENATDALTGFDCLGYVSEDGVENTNEMDMSEVKAWGGVTVLRSLAGLTDEYAFTLIESKNEKTLKNVYGDGNVTQITVTDDEDAGTTHTETKITVNADEPVERIYVIELALRGGTVKRIVIPDGAITAREPITYNDSDAIGYGVTVTAYPDENGATHFEYLK